MNKTLTVLKNFKISLGPMMYPAFEHFSVPNNDIFLSRDVFAPESDLLDYHHVAKQGAYKELILGKGYQEAIINKTNNKEIYNFIESVIEEKNALMVNKAKRRYRSHVDLIEIPEELKGFCNIDEEGKKIWVIYESKTFNKITDLDYIPLFARGTKDDYDLKDWLE